MNSNRIFLGFKTAFWIWRKLGPYALTTLKPTRINSLKGGAPTVASADTFRRNHPDLATKMLDVLVQGGDHRNVPGVHVHIFSHDYPERSFYRLDDNVFVASPELCLMQLASQLTEAETVKLAMEMCGTYAIDPLVDDPGFLKRPALTSAAKIRAYADRLYRPDSRARPTRFIRWVVDVSASPRETALCMLLCMPPRFGGYGIALPKMNKRVTFKLKDQLMMDKSYYVCDLLWPTRKFALEYDSAKHHTLEEKQELDAIRRNMLEYKGIRVHTATRTQVNSAARFDKLARQVADATGKRLRLPEQSHIEMRYILRKTLFKWDIMQHDDLPYTQLLDSEPLG